MTKRPKAAEETSSEYDDLIKTVGSRIREARQKAGLTQAQAGVKAGLAQSYIFELETGGANITLRTLAKMADVLGVDARDLLPESRTAAPSSVGLDLLQGLLERVATTLSEYHSQEARRGSQEAQFVAELRAFLDLRVSLERAMKSDQILPADAHPRTGSGRAGGPRKASH